ncbi:stemmadenine O-acetyltransferase-like [Euphorbia lathyris]|uniref:stemmadenine O-acetyltransferase-like n=1 Tax=Euphorbia lathyris TaxID=212925 RepID=UPI0033130FE8
MASKAIEILYKEAIKPCSPTPDSLKILKLSLLDQFTPITYTPLLLFYSDKHGDIDCDIDRHKKSEKLKASLSETLTQFYPLAGRLRDNSSIDCNDEGAEYIEARIECSLSEILNKPEPELLKQFLPEAVESPQAATGNLLLVQATFFDCGGFAIGICVSHKISDAATLTTFVNCWSATATTATATAISNLVFMADSMYPPIDIPLATDSIELQQQKKCVTKRFVFDGLKIAALREKSASETVQKPTRVEAVSGLIWKGILTALRHPNLNIFKPSIWCISVNLRSRMIPPIPENYSGNFVGCICPEFGESETGIELKGLVGRIRKEMDEFGENYVKKIQGEEGLLGVCMFAKKFGELAMNNEIDFFICTSWCKFNLYDGDFGFGKPVWVSQASINIGNVAVLMDTRDGDGIEAWLTLSEEEMSLFESDEELLQFAEVNPSVTFT